MKRQRAQSLSRSLYYYLSSFGLTITGRCLILVAQRLVPQERKVVREVMALAVEAEESGLRLKAADDT